MSYSSLQDLIDRFGADEILQLTDRAGLGVIDTAIVGRALADADALIDAHLSVRYALPLPHVPAIVVKAAADIARYCMWDDRASEEVRARYDDALRLLLQIARGDVALGLPQANQPTSTGGVSWSAPGRVMTVDMRGP